MPVVNFDVRALRHKIEAVEGVAEALAGADALRIIDGSGQIQRDPVTVNWDKPNGGARPFVPVRGRVLISGQTPLLGASAAGSAIVYSALARNCGHTEVLTAGPPANAEYTPVLQGFPSATGFFNHAGEVLRGAGGRGRYTSFFFGINDFPRVGFEWLAKLVGDPIEEPIWEDDVSAFGQPVVLTEDNLTVTLGGVALEFVSLTMDTGTTLSLAYHSENSVTRHGGREVTGTLKVYRPLIATAPIRQLVRTAALQPFLLDVVTGTAALDMSLEATNVQMGEPQPTNTDGLLTWDIPVTFTDDYILRFGSRT